MIEVRPGDIVEIDRLQGRWVVATFHPDQTPHGTQWRCMRPSGSQLLSMTRAPAQMTLLKRPTFAVGDTVTVGGLKGVIEALIEDRARVALAPHTRLIRKGFGIRHDDARIEPPLWQLSLENHYADHH